MQIIFFLSLFFYLLIFRINLWHRKYVTVDVIAVFVNNQHGILRRGQEFDKKFVFEEVHSKEVHRRCNVITLYRRHTDTTSLLALTVPVTLVRTSSQSLCTGMCLSCALKRRNIRYFSANPCVIYKHFDVKMEAYIALLLRMLTALVKDGEKARMRRRQRLSLLFVVRRQLQWRPGVPRW